MIPRPIRAAVIFVAGLALPAFADPVDPAALRLPLLVQVARTDGEPVADRAAIEAMVVEVNQLFAAAGICFALDARALDRGADLLTVRDRHAFAPLAVDHAINVFLVRSIKDPDPDSSTVRAAARAGRAPSGFLNGAEIPHPGHAPDLYLLLRVAAGAKGLAHELGHLFGEGHARAPENLMSYDLDRSRFDERQLRAFRLRAAAWLGDGTLRPVERCAAP